MKLAFYKGKGNWIDKIIRWRTKSIYSHAELIFDDNDLWFSSSPSSGVRFLSRVNPTEPADWDYIYIPASEKIEKEAYLAAREIEGKKYDWIGAIFGVGLKTKLENPKRFFCCEAIAYALQGFVNIKSLNSPYGIYRDLVNINNKEINC